MSEPPKEPSPEVDAALRHYGLTQGTGETVRETIIRSIRESETPSPIGSVPPINIQALADKAVAGLCDTLGLLFALPFGDDLYHGNPITVLHLCYLAAGLSFAVIGHMWPWIRTRKWLPFGVSLSLSAAALDARYWIATLLIIFTYTIGPEIYHRATEPRSLVTSPTADEVAAAVIRALPKDNPIVTNSPPALAPKQPEPPNPLRPEIVKWRATARLVDASKNKISNARCCWFATRCLMRKTTLPI